MINNKYGSLVDSFFAYDMYNLVMPAVPPADLSISANTIVPTYLSFRNSNTSRVVGFDIDDNPYIRGLGLTSNLADGLVDANRFHMGSSTSWRAILRPHRVSAALTGTISNTAGNAAVVGAATLFTRELAVGSVIIWVDDIGVQRTGTVLTIASDTSLTLTAVTDSTVMWTSNTSTSTAYQLTGQAGYAGQSVSLAFLTMNTLYPFAFFAAQATLLFSPRGKITVTAGSATVTGIGTTFLTDMVQDPSLSGTPGQGYVIGWTDDTGIRRTGVVSNVASNTSLTLQAVAIAGSTGTNVPLLDLDNTLRLRAEMPASFAAYTIAIDPLFGTRRMSLAVMAEIEHTFSMTGTV